MTSDEESDFPAPSQYGKNQGPTPKSRALSDLYVYQISDVVPCHPLHVGAECLPADPDLRRSPIQGSDHGFLRWHALASDGRKQHY